MLLHIAKRVIIYNNRRTILSYAKPIPNFYNAKLRLFCTSEVYTCDIQMYILRSIIITKVRENARLDPLVPHIYRSIWTPMGDIIPGVTGSNLTFSRFMVILGI